MKRPGLLVAVLFAMLSPALFAQPTGTPQQQAEKGNVAAQDEGKLEYWKIANFLLLAGTLGYLIRKSVGPLFAERSRKILQGIVEADDLRKEAERRVAEVDRRLANLEADIAALRSESQLEAEAETERIRQHTAAELAKLREHTEQEIASAGKSARLELKRYSADLAIDLARQQVRARMTPEAQDALVEGFVQNLKGSPSQVPTT